MTCKTLVRIMETGDSTEVMLDLAHVVFWVKPTLDKHFYKGCSAVALSNGVVLVLKVTPAEMMKLKQGNK